MFEHQITSIRNVYIMIFSTFY